METYVGMIRSPADAITLFEACRIGLLPRVCRRLSEKERQNIKSGSVFVWDEREAGMRRWTDGKSWSASRVSGSFLTYREMEGKRSGVNNPFSGPARSGRTPDAGSRNSDEGDQGNNDDGHDGYRYKLDGLLKQSFSITTSVGQHLHLISYYSRNQAAQAHLKQPTNDPALRSIKPAPGMYPESSVQDSHAMPAVTRSPMSSVGLPHQPPRGPGYAKAYLPPQSHPPPPYAAGPPSYPQGYSPLPPQVTVYSPAPYPAQSIAQQAGQPGYYPGQPPPPLLPMGAAVKETVAGYVYRSAELPPPTSFGLGSALAPPRSATPPSDHSRPLHHRTGSAGSYQQQSYYPSPHSGYTLTPQPSISSHPSQNNSPSSTPPASSLDPRSTIAPSPLSQQSPRTLHPEHGPALPRRSLSPHRTPPTSYPPSLTQALPQINHPTSAPQQSASTIPSINALVNGADVYERDRARSRSVSRSPGGGHHATLVEGKAQSSQWSRDKIDLSEDRRALNVLNKAFRT